MWIKNGLLLNDDFSFVKSDIRTENDKIAEIGIASGEDCIDASDCYVVPGFVDTHMHAAYGKLFIDYEEDTADVICRFEAKNGTTTLIPAISAAPTDKLVSCIKYLRQFTNRSFDECAMIRGIHLEGPFFAEEYKGAHLPQNIRHPSVEEYRILKNAAENDLKILTMAPELPNAEQVIPLAVSEGVCVSAGHTNATSEQMKQGIDWGVSQGTHLFNAMRGIGHREPGSAGALLLDDRANCELICDFLHVHPDIIKMVYKLKGRHKINLITDSEVATGMSDGVYEVNGRKLIVKDRVTRTEDGAIAGGTSCLLDCVKNVVSLGIPLEEACQMATKNPASSAGVYDMCGSLTVGKHADILILDKEYHLKHVILHGKMLF